MTKQDELLVTGCKLMGLSREDAILVYRILLSPEQVEDMLVWMANNIKSHPKPMDVIIAACEIQENHKYNKCSKLK